MEKDEILANMYALRAGLSVVAVNSDKVERTIKKAQGKAKDLEKAARDKKKKTEKDIESHTQKLAHAHEELDELDETKKRVRANNAREAGRITRNVAKVIVTAVAAVLLIGASVYCGAFWVAYYDFAIKETSIRSEFLTTLYGWGVKFIDAGGGWSSLAALIVTLIAFAATVGIIVLFFMLLFRIGRFKADKSLANMSTESEITADIAYYNSAVSKQSSTLPELDKNIDKAIYEGKCLVADACVSVAPTASAAVALYDALKQTFNPFLDERDWGNLDLLTYYIETGRADSVKESLQLLDRQKQTDQIVAAVNEAAGAICKTVKAGLFRLQNDMRKCFNILSERIDEVSYSVSAVNSRISSVESSMAAQSAQLSELASAASMSRALEAKSNVGSTQLIESVNTISSDLHYITEQQRWSSINRGGF